MNISGPNIFSQADHELYVITACHNGVGGGQLASWVLPATLAPGVLRAVVVLSKENHTTGLVFGSGRLAISLLAVGQEELVAHFGILSGHDVDKLAAIACDETPLGIPVPAGTCGYVAGAILQQMDLGDRVVVAVQAKAARLVEGRRPLTKARAFDLLPPETRAALEHRRTQLALRDARLLAAAR